MLNDASSWNFSEPIFLNVGTLSGGQIFYHLRWSLSWNKLCMKSKYPKRDLWRVHIKNIFLANSVQFCTNHWPKNNTNTLRYGSFLFECQMPREGVIVEWTLNGLFHDPRDVIIPPRTVVIRFVSNNGRYLKCRNFVILLRAKRVGEFFEIRHQKISPTLLISEIPAISLD